MIVDAILVAAGSGDRFGGGRPKQLQQMGGLPMWRWSFDRLMGHARIRQCVVVVPPSLADQFLVTGAALLVGGGASRSASVQAGLDALEAGLSPPDYVLIHDAARPGVSDAVIDGVIDALSTAPAAAPALPVVDALKRSSGRGMETVDRSDLYRVQTPQGFHFSTIRRALTDRGQDLVDDLAAVEAQGAAVRLTDGDVANEKVTYREDFNRVERQLKPHATLPTSLIGCRIGKGFDVHALEPGDHVTLCGVDLPHTATLRGHSDADVAWHALTDAILGALALGDIGDHFPPSDPQWKGAPSNLFLDHAAQLARAQGFAIANVDITVICEAPKVKPHREAMRTTTAEVLGVDVSQVSVKATTTEALGFTGRGEGIAAEAVVMLVKQ